MVGASFRCRTKSGEHVHALQVTHSATGALSLPALPVWGPPNRKGLIVVLNDLYLVSTCICKSIQIKITFTCKTFSNLEAFAYALSSLDPYNKLSRLADIIMPHLEKQETKILME